MPPAPAPHDPRFIRARRVIFGIALASFVLSFFHRTAPAAIADELARAFAINSALLGTLAATYFYVYTVLQIPVGVLADTMGPRRLLAAGSLVAGLGSIAFALAPTWEIAAVGRTLVGVGVSVAFIAILKVSAVWFPAGRFATLNGITMFAGNLGAVIAGAPLAWLVTLASWRVVFLGLAALSIALGIATWLKVRDRPEDLGFPSRARIAAGRTGEIALGTRAGFRAVESGHMAGILRQCRNRRQLPRVRGPLGGPLSRADLRDVARRGGAAHERCCCSALRSARCWSARCPIGSRSRRGVMRVYAVLYLASWLPWLLHVQWPLAATLAWFGLMGLLIPGFTLTWAVAKEVNRPEHSGIATSVANVGIFVGTGILQPLVGAILDRGRATGDAAGAWDTGIAVLAGSAAFGAAMTFFVRERTR